MPVSALGTSALCSSLPMSASSGSVPTAERRTSVAHGPGTSTTPGSWPAFESGSDGRTYMQPTTRKRVRLIGVPLVVVAGTAGFIWGGLYKVAADDIDRKRTRMKSSHYIAPH